MRAIAVLNQDAGTFRTTDMNQFVRLVEDVFHAHGHEISCRLTAGKDVIAAFREASSLPNIDAVIIGGGDGSVSAAAGIAWKKGMTLGVIPAGTMNLFARAIGLSLDIWQTPEELAAWNVKAVDIGDAGGEPFVHQFGAGMHARMIMLREAMTYRSRLGKIIASIRSSVGVIMKPPSFEVAFTVAGHHEKMRVSAVSVSNNAYGPSPYLIPERVDGGHLGIYLAEPLTPPGALRLAFDMMRGKLKENTAVRNMTAEEVTLRFHHGSHAMRCVIDGELRPCPRELVLRIHAGELKILAPQLA